MAPSRIYQILKLWINVCISVYYPDANWLQQIGIFVYRKVPESSLGSSPIIDLMNCKRASRVVMVRLAMKPLLFDSAHDKMIIL